MADSLTFVSKEITNFSNDVSLVLCNKSGNVLFSPFGLFTMLSMAYHATSGSTARHLKSVLYVTDIVTSAEECKLLFTTFEKLTDVKFCSVCNIAIRDNMDVKKEYTDAIKRMFDTTLLRLPFKKKGQTEKKINAWLDKSTKSKIHSIVKSSDFHENSDMIMVSGVYMKGDWMQRFEIYKNTREEFYVTRSESVKCAMVKMQSVFRYADRDDIAAQVVCIGLKNPTVSLLMILPRTRDGLKDVENKLFKKNLADLFDDLGSASVVITLPKMKLENEVDAEEILRALGLEELFTGEANYQNMTDEKVVKADRVLQKVFFETGDQGNVVLQIDRLDLATTAAPVTLSTSPSYGKYSFCANHPFIYMVCYHDKCFIPLIVGRYAKP